MKISSIKIDEVVCLSLNVIGADSASPIVTAEFGYLADGFRCGQVEVRGINDEAVANATAELVSALEEHFSGLISETSKGDTPAEIRGLVHQEF